MQSQVGKDYQFEALYSNQGFYWRPVLSGLSTSLRRFDKLGMRGLNSDRRKKNYYPLLPRFHCNQGKKPIYPNASVNAIDIIVTNLKISIESIGSLTFSFRMIYGVLDCNIKIEVNPKDRLRK